MKPAWTQEKNDWWMRDFTTLPDTSGLHDRALRGYWQKATYEAKGFSGTMVLANPNAQAPELRIPLPVTGRYSISIGMAENYSDRLLLKLERESTFGKIAHGPVSTEEVNCIQDVWWRDVDLVAGDVLVLIQDRWMSKRCGIAYVRLSPAPPATKPEIDVVTTMDGGLGNNGNLPLDEVVAEELQFADTHVNILCHGTDYCGSAQYITAMPHHRWPVERWAEEELISHEYYPWHIDVLQRYEKAGRCPFRDSIEAAHRMGRKIYAYHRMGIVRLYAPMQMFACPFYDEHPEWRCLDWDGTPIARLSIAFPEVRTFFLEHFREVVEMGADGVCLVYSRGWPLILFDPPVAEEYKRRTGREMKTTTPDDATLLQVRIDIFNQFMRDIQKTIREAARGRDVQIVTINLALPEINRHYAMDCETWAREGIVQMIIPYPYGLVAKPKMIEVPKWTAILKGTKTKLCPILNRMTYEPAGIIETPTALLDRAEKFLADGANGISVWDLDGNMVAPMYRQFAYHLGSKAGRSHLRKLFASEPIRYPLKTLDGITVDRYHPGWNV